MRPENPRARGQWVPRPLRAEESAVVKQLLRLDRSVPHFDRLLASVDHLIVREGCDCGCDALFFDYPQRMGKIIVGGVGRTAENHWVEAALWARETTLTFLELEPLTMRPRHLARLPEVDSLIPYPDDFMTRSW